MEPIGRLQMLVTTTNLHRGAKTSTAIWQKSPLYYTRIKYLITSICNVFWTIYTDLAIQGFKETTWHMGQISHTYFELQVRAYTL